MQRALHGQAGCTHLHYSLIHFGNNTVHHFARVPSFLPSFTEYVQHNEMLAAGLPVKFLLGARRLRRRVRTAPASRLGDPLCPSLLLRLQGIPTVTPHHSWPSLAARRRLLWPTLLVALHNSSDGDPDDDPGSHSTRLDDTQ